MTVVTELVQTVFIKLGDDVVSEKLSASFNVFLRIFHKTEPIDIDNEALVARPPEQVEADDELVKRRGNSLADAKLLLRKGYFDATLSATGVSFDNAVNVWSFACFCMEIVANAVDFDICTLLRLVKLLVNVVSCIANSLAVWKVD